MSILSDYPDLSAPQLRRQADGSMRNVNQHHCLSCHTVHFADYGTWCRAERKRLCPSNCERWPEAEQPKRSSLTWDQQQTVWAHMDAWEGYFDGQMTLAEAKTLVAALETLPTVLSPGALARRKTVYARPMAAVPRTDTPVRVPPAGLVPESLGGGLRAVPEPLGTPAALEPRRGPVLP